MDAEEIADMFDLDKNDVRSFLQESSQPQFSPKQIDKIQKMVDRGMNAEEIADWLELDENDVRSFL